MPELFPKREILGFPKLNEFADNNFEFDRNCEIAGSSLNGVENSVGK